MHPKKLNRLLFEISRNARITTRELGKLLRTSQQSASYLVRSAIGKGKINGFYTLADPARFGLITVLVLYHYTGTGKHGSESIVQALHEHPWVTGLEECSLGADLVVEYCAPNLSFFNKQHQDFLHRFKDSIRMDAIYPLIVKHLYNRKYLLPRKASDDVIISGDREPLALTPGQKSVLRALVLDPRSTMLAVAQRCSMDVKTALKTKAELERQGVIRGYNALIDHKKCGIRRRFFLLQPESHEPQELERILTFCRYHPNVLTAAKLIGTFELLLTVERLDPETSTIHDLRKAFAIQRYQLIISSRQVKRTSVPETLLT